MLSDEERAERKRRLHAPGVQERARATYAENEKNGTHEPGKKARKRARNFTDLARFMLEADIQSEEEMVEELMRHGLGEEQSYAMAVLWAQMKKAIYGDTEAAKFVRDSAGFKPTEALQIGNKDDVPFAMCDVAALSNEQLLAMIADRESEYDED